MGPLLTSKPAFEAIVLDLDGTLIDSVPQVCWAMNRVFDEEGLGSLGVDEVEAIVGEGVKVMFEKALATRGGPSSFDLDTMIARYLDVYLSDPAAQTVIYEGVCETLDFLTEQGLPMGICTNKPRASTRAVLDALGLTKYFDVVVTAEDTLNRKPDGRHVLETLAAMGRDGATAVMVGDSESDIRAGRDAGLATVAVTYGYCHVPFADLGADAVIDNFDALPETLTRLASGPAAA